MRRGEGFALMKRTIYDAIDKCVRPVALLPVLTMWLLVSTDVLDEYGRWAKFGVLLASFVPYLFGYNTVVRGWLHDRIED